MIKRPSSSPHLSRLLACTPPFTNTDAENLFPFPAAAFARANQTLHSYNPERSRLLAPINRLLHCYKTPIIALSRACSGIAQMRSDKSSLILPLHCTLLSLFLCLSLTIAFFFPFFQIRPASKRHRSATYIHTCVYIHTSQHSRQHVYNTACESGARVVESACAPSLLPPRRGTFPLDAAVNSDHRHQ